MRCIPRPAAAVVLSSALAGALVLLALGSGPVQGAPGDAGSSGCTVEVAVTPRVPLRARITVVDCPPGTFGATGATSVILHELANEQRVTLVEALTTPVAYSQMLTFKRAGAYELIVDTQQPDGVRGRDVIPFTVAPDPAASAGLDGPAVAASPAVAPSLVRTTPPTPSPATAAAPGVNKPGSPTAASIAWLLLGATLTTVMLTGVSWRRRPRP